MANVAILSASPQRNNIKGNEREGNISPQKIRQILAEKEEFILSLERQLGDVMEELSAARGEQLKWQRKHQQQEGLIAQCQEKIKTYESNISNASRYPQRIDQGRSTLQAGALSSLNRYQYQRDNSDNFNSQNNNEKRDYSQQSPKKQYNYSNNARNYIDEYDQPELKVQVNSEKKHIKQQKLIKYIPSEEDVKFYSEQKQTKAERIMYHNPNPVKYYENGKEQYHQNQRNQSQQQYAQDTNIFSIPRHNDIHRRLQSTPNISLIKIPSCKLQKLSSKEVKHRLHLIPAIQQ